MTTTQKAAIGGAILALILIIPLLVSYAPEFGRAAASSASNPKSEIRTLPKPNENEAVIRRDPNSDTATVTNKDGVPIGSMKLRNSSGPAPTPEEEQRMKHEAEQHALPQTTPSLSQ